MKLNKLYAGLAMGAVVLSTVAGCSLLVPADRPVLSPEEQLGKSLFFDSRLSEPQGVACSGCHAPQTGFADPRGTAFSQGVNPAKFTDRNSPTITYSAFVPKLSYVREEDLVYGGLFWDGRALSLSHQLEGPMFSSVEMGIESKSQLYERLKELGYLDKFRQFYGEQALANSKVAFNQLSHLITSYERSQELNSFSSKYDYYLAGKSQFTEQEKRGLALFEREDKGNCAACHPNKPAEEGGRALFTDFTYDNLGVPPHPEKPNLADKGLGEIIYSANTRGKFRVPTLRNIALTGPYMHNGVFASLEEVVSFYNTRDVDSKWRAPEISENVNKKELGNLKLSAQDEADIVAFLKTLTDGYDYRQEWEVRLH